MNEADGTDLPNDLRLPVIGVGRRPCPVCGGNDLAQVVAFSTPRLCNVLFENREDAFAADIGLVTVCCCRDCDHLFNSTFEEESVRYTPQYDSSLEHSPRFAAFGEDLVARLNKAYSLAGKTIVEIGCGKGRFLKRICALSRARGIGFDASYEDSLSPAFSNVTFVRDYFGERYPDVRPDLVVCRHVLEHIERPVAFLRSLRAHPGVGPDTHFYFEVPNALYTLRDLGIWDFIYEHASYFTMKSLCAAFRLAGYEVRDAGASFGEQYLFVQARAAPGAAVAISADLDAAESLVASFSEIYRAKIARWSDRLAAQYPAETVIWGAGSKGITFVNAVAGGGKISALVDLNPNKQGRFAPRYGTPVVSPGNLREQQVKTIVVMNPIYADEIARAAAAVAPRAELILA